MIRFSGSPSDIQAVGGRCLGFAVLLGVWLGAACGVVGTVVAGPLRSVLIVLGLSFPLLLVQDTGRVICFAQKRPRTAAINDAAWAVAQLALLGAVLAIDAPLWAFVASWLVAGGLAGLIILGQLTIYPTLRKSTTWVSENRSLSIPLFGVYILTAAPQYLVFALAPAVSSLAELGLARAAYVPFAVFGVVMQTAWLLLIPAGARKERQAIRRLARQSSFILGGLALVWSVLMVFALPASIGTWLIGGRWYQTGTARSLFAVSLVAQAATVGPLMALPCLQAPKRLLRVRAVTGPIMLCGGLLLARAAGAVGIAIAISLADVFGGLFCWLELHYLTSGNRASASSSPLGRQPLDEVISAAEAAP